MARGNHLPLIRAVEARQAGKEPAAADLAVCKRGGWKAKDLSCWNGKRSDRPHCGWNGSQNLPVLAMAGRGDWQWIASLARLGREEGNFGQEIGAPSSFYYSAMLGCYALAMRHLSTNSPEAAEDCRLAIRSALAWDAMTAVPTARIRDEVHYPDEIKRAENLEKKRKSPTVAVSGNRWTPVERGALTSEDAHSDSLRAALARPGEFGLTERERQLVGLTVNGDVDAAREVAGWMFGTIQNPDKEWRFRLRRTTEGAESVYGWETVSWPSPYKPARSVTQVRLDGTWIGAQPCPSRHVEAWANGYRVTIVNGIIRAECAAGAVEIPELGGEILWQVDVHGHSVRFSAGAAAAA